MIKNIHYFLNIIKNTQLTDNINIIFSDELIIYKALSESSSDDEESSEENIV